MIKGEKCLKISQYCQCLWKGFNNSGK